MESYKQLVRENAQAVKKFEDLARFGTIVLPKGPLGEVATEGSYAILGLVGVINDAIIHGRTKRAGEAWSFAGGEKQYQVRVTFVRALLTFFAHCEALLEVSAAKWGAPGMRDRLILIIEMVKAVARLVLLRWFPRECIYAGGKFESYIPPAAPEGGQPAAPEESVAPAPSPKPPAADQPSWTGRRSGLSLKVSQNVQKYMDPSAPNPVLLREMQLRVIAEVLHILRPVVFVVLSRRFKDRWWPFLLSLGLDLVSLKTFQTAAKIPSLLPSMLPSTAASHDVAEFRRRAFLLLFYLFRSPLYESSLGAFSASLVDTFKNVPGMATIAELIAFQFDFYHTTHFYSAAS